VKQTIAGLAGIAAFVFGVTSPTLVAALNLDLDNYKCYKVKDLKIPQKFQATTVDLADQFAVDDGSFTATKPFLFCDPVDASGGGILNGADHLTCYKVKGPKPNQGDRPHVEIVNQLGTTRLEAKKALLLCVPSTANPVGETAVPRGRPSGGRAR
jgi:hypothetical protein